MLEPYSLHLEIMGIKKKEFEKAKNKKLKPAKKIL